MKYQDIQISDVALRKQFVDNWNNGQYSQALAILSSNNQLNGKSMVSDNMTSINNQITILEDYYYEEVEDKLEDELTLFNDRVEKLVNKGNWSGALTYYKSNYVVYNENVYMCLQSNTNTIPTNTTYWLYLGLKGDVGEFGIDVVLKYGWSNNIQYNAKDVVLYNNKLYFATSSNINSLPTSLVDWQIFLDIEKVTITATSSEPTSPYDGMVWFDVN